LLGPPPYHLLGVLSVSPISWWRQPKLYCLNVNPLWSFNLSIILF